MTRKIVCISGSRADYHLMQPVYDAVAGHDALSLELLATCAHLHPMFRASSEAAFRTFPGPIHRVNMLLADDNGTAMAQSLGLGVVGMAQALEELKPDVLLLQGDRGEMLAGAIAAAHMNIPVVHMSGGDRTGSIDNAIRNAVTQFAHMHLTTCSTSTKHLLEMGEHPDRVVQVGEPALDRLLSMRFMTRGALCAALHLDAGQPILVATLHPVTTRAEEGAAHMRQMLDALERVAVQTVCTAPNTDAGGRAMQAELDRRAGASWLRVVDSLGFERYASLLKEAVVMVGNSSSGILEAPSFGLPVVNVGQRQHGRQRAGNVLDVEHDAASIEAGVRRGMNDAAFREACRVCINPYGDGRAAQRTADMLAGLRLGPELLEKWRTSGTPLCGNAL